MAAMTSMTIGWRDLHAEHRRWIVVNALIVSAFVNLGINGVLAWLSVRGHHAVPIWGLPGLGKTNVVTDSVGTLFLLPFFTCAMCTTAVWREVRAERLPRLEALVVPPSLAHGRLRRGAVLGVATAAVVSPVIVTVLALSRLGTVSAPQFVLYKAVFAVVLGAAVTPIIAVLAMAGSANGRRPGT